MALCGSLIPFYKAKSIHLDCGKDQAILESGYLHGDAAFSVNSACPSPEDLGTIRRFSPSCQEKEPVITKGADLGTVPPMMM